MGKKLEVMLSLVGLVIAILGLLFGDNIYQQIVGRSIFGGTEADPAGEHTGGSEYSEATPVEIFLRPSCGTTFRVEASRSIMLYYGAWAAKGKDLLNENIDYMTVKLLVDGSQVNGTQRPIVPMSDIPCGKDLADSYWVTHIAQLDSLKPGEHQVEVWFTFDTSVTDGYDEDNDGELDTYGPDEPVKQVYTIKIQ